VLISNFSTRPVGRSLKRAAVPLAALALTAGLAACEFPGSDDKKADGPSSPKSSTNPTTSGGTGDPKKSPNPKPGNPGKAPASEQKLTTALLDAQEIPAGLRVDNTAKPAPETDVIASDPKCQAMLTPDKTAVQAMTRMYVADDAGEALPDVDITLGSYEPEELDAQWDAYVAAVKDCKTFTATNEDASVEYTVLEVVPDAYGPNSIRFTASLRVGEESALFVKAVTRIGSTVVHVDVVGEDGSTEVPTFPANIVEGQNDKVRTVIGE